MNLLEHLLTEALSPELAAALQAAGHEGPEAHVSRTRNEPTSSTVILHDNPRAQSKEYGYEEGKYRITFLDKAPLYKMNGSEEYKKEISPSGHIAYHDVNDAIRHFGTIKQLHAGGVANNLLTPYFGINADDFNYEPRSPKQKARGLADMSELGPDDDNTTAIINRVAGQEMQRDLKNLRAKYTDEAYNHEILHLANLLTEDAMYNHQPVAQLPPVEVAQPRKIAYRRLAQIASTMGV